MKTLRDLYIETGAIVPKDKVQHATRTVLRLDAVGRAAVDRHIEDERRAAEAGTLCEIPLDQVPDFVVEYWERHRAV